MGDVDQPARVAAGRESDVGGELHLRVVFPGDQEFDLPINLAERRAVPASPPVADWTEPPVAL